jgi:DNA-directed RNA polymerase specialized sigma24 family protein
MTPPVQAYRPENHQDFDRLYTETYRRVFATLVVVLRNPDAAEDAAQEGYLRACRAWKTWKKDAPAEAWLFRIALNVAFTYRRRERLYKVGEVLRRLGRPRELSVNRVKIDRSFVNPDALRSR